MSPAISLAIDVAAVTLLILCRTGVETASESRLRRVFPRVASSALVLSLLATSVSLYGQSRFVPGGGRLTTAGDLVILEPESWAGKPWPLLGESGVPVELAVGQWDVLLFRHDCHVCHDVMLEAEQLLSARDEQRGIALIGIDRRRDDEQIARLCEQDCLLGYLPEDRAWFTTTPLRLRLSDGVCLSASVIEHWE